MGVRAGALAVIVVAGLVANVQAGSAGAGQASGTGGDETSTVTYSGTLNNTVQLVDDNNHVTEILTQDVTWRATWAGPTNMISDQSGKTLPWTSVSLSGSDSIQYPDSNQGPGQSQNCADSLSAAPGQTFNAILPYGGDSITFALNTLAPHQTPTQGGGCFMPGQLACPPGSVPNEPKNTGYCNPGPAWKFKDGAKTFDISSSYGPTNVGVKVVTSDLTSTVSVSGAGCALSSSPASAASMNAYASLGASAVFAPSLGTAAAEPACTVSISPTPARLELRQREALQAKLSPSSASATSYSFEIKRAKAKTWDVLRTTSKPSYTYRANVAGHFEVRVIALAQGKKLISRPQTLEVRFPSYAEIVADKTVKEFTDAAWKLTLRLATPTSRREVGFWIWLSTCKGGGYGHLTTVIPAEPTGNSGTAGVQLGTRPADDPQKPSATRCARYFVADFHTHTPTKYRRGNLVRGVGPSPDDVRTNNRDEVPGLVYDYFAFPAGGRTIPFGYPLDRPAGLYRSGPDRRPTPS